MKKFFKLIFLFLFLAFSLKCFIVGGILLVEMMIDSTYGFIYFPISISLLFLPSIFFVYLIEDVLFKRKPSPYK